MGDRQGPLGGQSCLGNDEAGGVEVPLRPMLGCVAVAPARKEAVATSTPGAFGGNMDYNGVVAGVTLMLPLSEPGALLFVGDGHARQGDGEVVGNALEVSMDVELETVRYDEKTSQIKALEALTAEGLGRSEQSRLVPFRSALDAGHRESGKRKGSDFRKPRPLLCRFRLAPVHWQGPRCGYPLDWKRGRISSPVIAA